MLRTSHQNILIRSKVKVHLKLSNIWKMNQLIQKKPISCQQRFVNTPCQRHPTWHPDCVAASPRPGCPTLPRDGEPSLLPETLMDTATPYSISNHVLTTTLTNMVGHDPKTYLIGDHDINAGVGREQAQHGLGIASLSSEQQSRNDGIFYFLMTFTLTFSCLLLFVLLLLLLLLLHT